MERLREEIDITIQIWTDLLIRKLGKSLKSLYAKGSAVKPWDTSIDYVPILSDVDLHINIDDRDSGSFFRGITGVQESLIFNREYRTQFKRKLKNPIHIPRVQLVLLNELIDEPFYVPPRQKDIRLLVGEVPVYPEPSKEKINEIDRQRIVEDASTLDRLGLSIVDRSGLDFWTIIRRLNWRVSPAPFRVYGLLHHDPSEVWGWNRTKIALELDRSGFKDFSYMYKAYYNTGWELFKNGFQDEEIYITLISYATNILEEAVRVIQGIK